MNANQLARPQKPPPSEPLFASTWLALFMVIRNELLSPRQGS